MMGSWAKLAAMTILSRLDSGCILKAEAVGFEDRLNEEPRLDSRAFPISTWVQR